MKLKLLKNKMVQNVLRAVFTAAILYVLIRYTDWAAFWNALKGSEIHWFVFGLGLNLLQQVVMAITLFVVLQSKGHHPKVWPLYKVILSTFFVAKFIPTSLGLDALRIYGVSKLSGDMVASASSMVMVRILGLFSSLLFAFIAVMLGGYLFTGSTLLVIVLVFVLLTSALVVGSSKKVRKQVGLTLQRIPFLRKYVDLFGQIAHSFYDLKSRPGIILSLFVFSVMFQAIRIFINYMVGLSLNIDVPLLYYFMFVPVVLLFAMLPLSFGGFGILTGGKVYFLLQAGATMDQGVGLSLLVMMINVLAGIPGAIVFFFEGISGGTEGKGHRARKEGLAYIRSMKKCKRPNADSFALEQE